MTDQSMEPTTIIRHANAVSDHAVEDEPVAKWSALSDDASGVMAEVPEHDKLVNR